MTRRKLFYVCVANEKSERIYVKNFILYLNLFFIDELMILYVITYNILLKYQLHVFIIEKL